MRLRCQWVASLVATLVATLVAVMSSGAQKAPLAVAGPDGWRGLWRPDASPPSRWMTGDTALLGALQWKAGRDGVRWAEIPLRGDGEAWRTRGIIVSIEPARTRFTLDTAFRINRDASGAVNQSARWRIEDAAARSIVAVNAGQFSATLFGMQPWGWVVLNGHEWRAPGTGPLSSAVIVDSSGSVRLSAPGELTTPARTRGVAYAFQSFPTLLDGDGSVPAPLRTTAGGVDLTHRDARLALGIQRDGTVLLVMTRFDVFGPTLGAVPFGLTTPEMAALMGALGCQRAVMLDGGISAQMQLRTDRGAMKAWPGWRRVPLGLLVFPATRTPAR